VGRPEVFGGHEALTRPALRRPYGGAKTMVGISGRRGVGMRPPCRRCLRCGLSSSFLFYLISCLSLRLRCHHGHQPVQLRNVCSVLGWAADLNVTSDAVLASLHTGRADSSHSPIILSSPARLITSRRWVGLVGTHKIVRPMPVFYSSCPRRCFNKSR
jgi:hypothetical protein